MRHRCWLGVDGTRTGWVVFALEDNDEYKLWHVSKLSDIEVLTSRLSIQAIAIDIPIGLLDIAERGGRGCDREARRILSLTKRNSSLNSRTGVALVGSSSVFSPPCRAALKAFCDGATHTQVSKANKQSAIRKGAPLSDVEAVGLGLSIQTFHILPKIREADVFVSSSSSRGFCQSLSVNVATFECHPELAFLSLSGGATRRKDTKLILKATTALSSKKTIEGRKQRLELLCGNGGLDAVKVLSLAGVGVANVNKPIDVLTQMRTWHIQDIMDEEKKNKTSVAADDVLDAMICAISSRKWSMGQLSPIQEDEDVQYDKRGLPMVIWI